MKNFQSRNVGDFQNLDQYVFAPDGTDLRIPGKLFLGTDLGLSGMEVSLNKDTTGGTRSCIFSSAGRAR